MRSSSRGLGLLGLVAATTLAALPLADAGADGTRDSAPQRGALLSIGLVADAQYCDCNPKRTRYYRSSLTKLSAAADVFNRRNVDFTVQVGDIIDRHSESFDRILPVYGQVESPRYHVLGNHDFALSSPAVVRRLGMPDEYYDFSQAGWRFVVLDTNDISLYANPEGSVDHELAEDTLDELRAAGAANAKGFNGAVGERQLRWLRSVLRESRTAGQRVLVFGHMPVHGTGPHNAWDDQTIRRVLSSSGNVVAYVNGHDHAGGYALQQGIHHVGLRGMVEHSPTSNAFAVLQVHPDELLVEGFGREPDRRLTITR